MIPSSYISLGLYYAIKKLNFSLICVTKFGIAVVMLTTDTRSSLKLVDGSAVLVANQDVYTLLKSTVRYSLGCMTYMSVLSIDLIQKYNNVLTDQQISQLMHEIEHELDRYSRAGTFCGSPLDHRHWRDGIVRLQTLLDNRRKNVEKKS